MPTRLLAVAGSSLSARCLGGAVLAPPLRAFLTRSYTPHLFRCAPQHLMRRIERGDQVRGISLKLQEEERERRMDFVPEVSAINTEAIVVDPDTKDLLSKLQVDFAGNVQVQQPQRQDNFQNRGPRGPPRQ
jgi:hypothetical protein